MSGIYTFAKTASSERVGRYQFDRRAANVRQHDITEKETRNDSIYHMRNLNSKRPGITNVKPR